MKKIIFLVMMVITLFGLASCSLLDGSSSKTTVIEPGNVIVNVSENKSTVSSIEEAVAKTYDSVVVINATSRTATSAGSGVIYGEDEGYTYIVTCAHVVDGYSEFYVTLSNGNSYEAQLIGSDSITDLAIVRIEVTGLNAVTVISNSDTITIGSECYAIGNPLGTLANSVTKGIISATGRSIKMSDGSVRVLIQTDAAINSGNSGGGLFNNQGQLIGIVSAKYSASGVEGLGFAIPTNTVLEIVNDLLTKGYVEGRTSLGVTISDGTVYSGGGFFGRYTKVVYISYVDEKGSAYGILKTEMIITGVKVQFADITKEDKTLSSFSSASEVNNFLDSQKLAIGDTVIFTVQENNSTKEYSVTLKQYK